MTPYSILIPIHNAYNELKECLASVEAHTEVFHTVWLLDDSSTDPKIAPLLDHYSQFPRFRVLKAASNLGFIKTINHGFSITQNDLVILNSDTVVTPGWLTRMHRCRISDPHIGIVSPLSNNATHLSVPQILENNFLPQGMSVSQMANLVVKFSNRSYPRIPTGVGFCMLITRRTLERVGLFDPAFGKGYGEEVDFSIRAWAKGIESACCDDAYVYHHGASSFGSPSPAKIKNEAILLLLWPNRLKINQEFLSHDPLSNMRKKIARALNNSNRKEEVKAPVALRSFLSRYATKGPASAIAHGWYHQSLRRFTHQFSRFPGVRAIYLRGGALKNPIPGISDLDLSLLWDPPPQMGSLVSRLYDGRAKYQSMRKKFFPLGEIVLWDDCTLSLAETLSPALLLDYLQHKCLSADLPFPTHFDERKVSSVGRLCFCLDLYRNGIESLVKARFGTQVYYMTRFQRRLDKALALSGHTHHSFSSIALKLVDLFFAIDHLAKSILARTEFQIHPLQTQWEKQGDLKDHGFWASTRWLGTFNQKSKVHLCETPIPFLYFAPEGETKRDLKELFETYLTSGVQSPVLRERSHAPMICPRSVLRCGLWTAKYFLPLTQLELIPFDLSGSTETEQKMRSIFLESLRETLAAQIITLSGEILFGTPESLSYSCHSLLVGAMIYATRSIERDGSILRMKARKLLPTTTSFLLRMPIHASTVLNRDFLESLFTCRLEIMDFLEQEMCSGRS